MTGPKITKMLQPARRANRELVPRPPGTTVHCNAFATDRFLWNWHHHPELELTLIVRGNGLRHAGRSVETLRAGELVLLGPNLPHSWATPVGYPGGCQAIVLQVHPDALHGACHGLPEHSELLRLLSRSRHGLVLDAVPADLAGLIHAAAAERSMLARLGLLLAALGRLAHAEGLRELHAQPVDGPIEASHPGLAMVLQRMRADPTVDLPLGRLAALAGLAPASLSRLFRRITGQTLVAYRNRLRLELACLGLAERDDGILEIALDAGFPSLTNFNRRFRQAFACTPSAYRRLARGR